MSFTVYSLIGQNAQQKTRTLVLGMFRTEHHAEYLIV